ncbi:MAG: gliding motility-associated C-terminal domain-containing protein [Saprospiraceae bacterium]|nr:gliding motility-associated C-terminal domain-containing protein [Saprospiraceae bacterium]
MLRTLLLFSLFVQFITSSIAQGCAGLNADAGPDQFTCDPLTPLQLMGSYSGIPDKYYWTPSTYLSDPNSTDPFVNAPPGKYTYTFKVESVGNMDFINNGNFESGNSGFSHEYNYGVPGGPFAPGWLSVGTNPFGYNTAWTACGDHTSGSGNQLIVDGHTNANAKVWCQTVNLTVGRTYLFRFFVQSVFPNNPAQLNALANNVIFGNIQAAGVCDWQMFEGCFTATSSNVEICIRETSGVGFGNDFAIDDISLFEKCMDEDEVIVEIIDLKAKINIPTQPKCASDIFDLNALGSSAGPNIQYEWSSVGGKIVSSNGLIAKGQGGGMYKIKVIYRNGNIYCEKEDEIEVEPSEDLEATLEVEGIANCNLDTIKLQASVLNGGGNFSYFWIPANKIVKGVNDPTAYVLEAGIYKVVIKDKDSGCETEIQDVVVSDTLKPQFSLAGDTLINCLIDTANLLSTPFDTLRFSYEWTLPDQSLINNKVHIQSTDSGVYKLKVFDKANKCFTEKYWNVSIDTTSPFLELGPDGAIDCLLPEYLVSAQGSPFPDSADFKWNLPGGISTNERSFATKLIRDSGWVFLTLINRLNGCEAKDSLYIRDFRAIPPAGAGQTDTLNCRKQSLVLNGTGKSDSTLVLWTTTMGRILTGQTSFSPEIDQSGWYYLNVTDTSNHCSNTDSVYIAADFNKPVVVTGADQIFTCADTLKILDAGGSSQGPEFTYNWTTSNGLIRSGQGTSQLLVNAPGTYLLEITNQTNGCSDTSSVLVSPDFSAPVGSIVQADTLTCNVRKITLSANASSPVGNPIRYHWIADAGQNINGPNTLNPEVQEAGLYTLIIFDEVNGCSTKVSIQVAVDTLSPLAWAGADQTWNCATTQLQLNGSNSSGLHPILFDWSSINGTIQGLANQNQIIAKAPGLYTLLVTDSVNGCIAMDTLIVIADTVKPVASILRPDTLTCLKTSVVLDASPSSAGGQLNYSWTTSNGQISGPSQMRTAIANQSGLYQLIIRDTLNFCSDTSTIVVLENTQKPILTLTGNTQLTCAVLSTLLQVNVQNSSGKINNLWSTSTGLISGNPSMDSIRVTRPGWYYIQTTDNTNGCSSLDSVHVDQMNDLKVDAGNTGQLTCNIKNLALTGTVFSGSGSEQYLWTTTQGNILSNPQSRNVNIDKAGIYYFRAFNPANGCDALDSVVVSENTNYPTQAELRVDPMNCPGDIWTVNIESITGGEAPLQITFEGSALPGRTIQGSLAGSYQIIITDRNGCELKKDFDILPATGVSMNLVPYVKINAGEFYTLQPTFSIPLDSIGSIHWSPSSNLSCTDCFSPVVQNLNDDIEYYCTVTDKKGCTASARIKIEVIKRNIWFPNAFSPNGDQINDIFHPYIEEGSFNQIKLFKIFDRWGNLLFERAAISPEQFRNGWDGNVNGDKAMPGVYLYVLQLEWKNGDLQIYSGDLSLIR